MIKIKGISMEPTLQSEDKSMMFKTVKPKVGDVIFVESGDIKIIKRLIAIEGDTVEIKDNELYVNDKKVNEPYIKEKMDTRDIEKFTLKEDELFVLGDNRNNSSDSREYGVYTMDDYLGKSLFYIRGYKIKKVESIKYDVASDLDKTSK